MKVPHCGTVNNPRKYPVGKIIAQEYPFRKRVDKIPNKSITVTIVKEGI